jgi:hypothetical protein
VKKLYTTDDWKRHSRRRAEHELLRRRAHKRWLTAKRQAEQRRPRVRQQRPRHRTRTLIVPAAFSFIFNPHESCEFIGRLRAAFSTGWDVQLDLSHVERLTSDAVLVLLSKLNDPRFVNGRTFGGNQPTADGPRALLRHSGFFEFVQTATLKEPSEHGRIRRRASHKVEAETADDLVAFATERVFGKRRHHRPSYETLIECMGNTHEHAWPARQYTPRSTWRTESWWANAYCPKDQRAAYFTIADNGVGIFRSVTVRRIRRNWLGSRNTDLLRDILERRVEFPSRTGLKNRGKGLRAMHRNAQRGKIRQLIFIANDVFANVSEGRYETLRTPFGGTMVYWELADDRQGTDRSLGGS